MQKSKRGRSLAALHFLSPTFDRRLENTYMRLQFTRLYSDAPSIDQLTYARNSLSLLCASSLQNQHNPVPGTHARAAI